jgi:hypothetical protein
VNLVRRQFTDLGAPPQLYYWRFKLIWRRRSRDRHRGRPRIPGEHRVFIRRISSDHPENG